MLKVLPERHKKLVACKYARSQSVDTAFFSTSLLPAFHCQNFLASHFRTDWLSRLELGDQVGSTTDHL